MSCKDNLKYGINSHNIGEEGNICALNKNPEHQDKIADNITKHEQIKTGHLPILIKACPP